MREEIYLIGQISVDNHTTYQWRQDVRRIFKEAGDNFEIIEGLMTPTHCTPISLFVRVEP